MVFKIIATLILIIEIINPKLFWKMRDRLSYNSSDMNKNYFLITRIASLIALFILWVFL